MLAVVQAATLLPYVVVYVFRRIERLTALKGVSGPLPTHTHTHTHRQTERQRERDRTAVLQCQVETMLTACGTTYTCYYILVNRALYSNTLYRNVFFCCGLSAFSYLRRPIDIDKIQTDL